MAEALIIIPIILAIPPVIEICCRSGALIFRSPSVRVKRLEDCLAKFENGLKGREGGEGKEDMLNRLEAYVLSPYLCCGTQR